MGAAIVGPLARVFLVTLLISGLVVTSAPAAEAASTLSQRELQRLLQEADNAVASARTLLSRGEKRQAGDRLREAEDIFRGILATNAQQRAAALGLSNVLFLSRRYEDGVALMRPFRERLPEDQDVAHQLGMHLYRGGEQSLAVPLLEQVAADEGRFDASWLLGVYYYRQAAWDKGLAHVERFVAARPEDTDALALLGTYYLKTRRFDDAVAALDRYLADHPSNMAARVNRANALFRSGKYDAASDAYEGMIADAPKRTRLVYNLASVRIKQNRCDDAVVLLDRFLASNAEASTAKYFRAECLLKLGRYAEAQDAFEGAQDASQSNPWIFLGLSRIALEQGDKEGANANAKKAVDLSPRDWEIVGWYGTILRKIGQPEDALAQHDAALGWAPDKAELHVERGRDLWVLERYADAQGAFDMALTHDPELAGAIAGAAASRTAQAVALRRSGDEAAQERVATLLTEAVDRWDYAPARVNLALIAVEAGESDQAWTLIDAVTPEAATAAGSTGDVAVIRAFIEVRRDQFEAAKQHAAAGREAGTQLGRLQTVTDAHLAAHAGDWEKAAEAFDTAKGLEQTPAAQKHLDEARTFAWFQVGLERLGRGDGPGARAALTRASAGSASFSRADKTTLRFATTALGVVSGNDPLGETKSLARLLRGRDYKGAAGRAMRETGQAYIAYGYLRGERPEDALKALQRVSTPTAATTQIKHAAEDALARRAFDQKRFKDAATIWTRLAGSDAADVESAHNAAVATFMAGDIAGAVTRWEALPPGSAPTLTLYNLGVAADRRGAYRQAYDLFKRYERQGGTAGEVKERLKAKARVFGYGAEGGI